MKTRDPVFNLLREFLGDPQSIPSLKQKPAKPPEIPLPRKTPEIPMMLWPPAFDPAIPDDYNPFIPPVSVFPSSGGLFPGVRAPVSVLPCPQDSIRSFHRSQSFPIMHLQPFPIVHLRLAVHSR